MTFLAFIVRNITRHRTRSTLTIVGIGIGITTVIALGSITSGLKAASVDLAHQGGADFMVAQKGASDMSFSILSPDDLETVRRQEGVERAWGALMHISRVGSNPFFLTYGVERADIGRAAPPLRRGRLPRSRLELVLGERAADDLGAGPGATVTVERRPFRVVGVYESSATFESSGGYALLEDVQEIARKPGTLSSIFVVVAPEADPEAVAARVERASESLVAISTADDYAQVDQGMQALDAGNLAISLLAVVIGAIGVMNTMIMSVFERTREIGILRAVGWRGSRVVGMVVGESLLLCVAAAVAGVGLGVAATRAVALVPAISGFLVPEYPADIFVRALVIAVGVALVGALYPALRAVRLSPMEALRHE